MLTCRGDRPHGHSPRAASRPARRVAAFWRAASWEGLAVLLAVFVLLVSLALLLASVPAASNYFLSARATTLQAYLNSGMTLRLFTDSGLTPTPATVLSDFTEATWSGYAPISLSSAFGSPAKIIDGEYEIQTGNLSWNGPSTGSQTVYGWYVTDGTGVIFSGAFSSAITMDSTVTLTLQLSPGTWDFSTVP